MITATYWDGPELRIQQDDGAFVELGPKLHWDVGPIQPSAVPDVHPCVFEPACLAPGVRCSCGFGAQPHVAYIAFYGVLPKVGMTTARRFAKRLREQGADAGFVLQRCLDRGAARQAEKDATFLHKLPQWRTHKETLPLLTKPVDWDKIASRADDWRRRLSDHFEPSQNLVRVDDVTLEPLPAKPHRVAVEGLHSGEYLGAKGNYIFWRARAVPERLKVGSPPVLALKHTELVGRTLD